MTQIYLPKNSNQRLKAKGLHYAYINEKLYYTIDPNHYRMYKSDGIGGLCCICHGVYPKTIYGKYLIIIEPFDITNPYWSPLCIKCFNQHFQKPIKESGNIPMFNEFYGGRFIYKESLMAIIPHNIITKDCGCGIKNVYNDCIHNYITICDHCKKIYTKDTIRFLYKYGTYLCYQCAFEHLWKTLFKNNAIIYAHNLLINKNLKEITEKYSKTKWLILCDRKVNISTSCFALLPLDIIKYLYWLVDFIEIFSAYQVR